MVDEEKCNEAIKLMASPDCFMEGKKVVGARGGRPRDMVIVRDGEKTITLTKSEYAYCENVVKNQLAESITVMTPEEMELLSRKAAPLLLKRMYELALQSTNLKDVVAAARFMAEYGYGRPVQKQEVMLKSDVIRRGWGDMEVLEGNFE